MKSSALKWLSVSAVVIMGLYWLVDHTPPMPFSHEEFGLYDHTMHQWMGLGCFAIAGLMGWLWRPKKDKK
jgi:hypothetical protein